MGDIPRRPPSGRKTRSKLRGVKRTVRLARAKQQELPYYFMGDIPRRPYSGPKIRLKKGGQARLNFFTIWLDCPPGAKQQELPFRKTNSDDDFNDFTMNKGFIQYN